MRITGITKIFLIQIIIYAAICFSSCNNQNRETPASIDSENRIESAPGNVDRISERIEEDKKNEQEYVEDVTRNVESEPEKVVTETYEHNREQVNRVAGETNKNNKNN